MFLNSNSDSISVQIKPPTLLTGSMLQADSHWTNCPGPSSTLTLPTCFLGGTSIPGFGLAHLLQSHRAFRSPYLTPRGGSPILIQSCTPNATGKLVTDLPQLQAKWILLLICSFILSSHMNWGFMICMRFPYFSPQKQQSIDLRM